MRLSWENVHSEHRLNIKLRKAGKEIEFLSVYEGMGFWTQEKVSYPKIEGPETKVAVEVEGMDAGVLGSTLRIFLLVKEAPILQLCHLG